MSKSTPISPAIRYRARGLAERWTAALVDSALFRISPSAVLDRL